MDDHAHDGSDPGGGSVEALFDIVAKDHAGLIYRIALAHEADPAIRGELVQDIMLAIWGSLPRFRRDASLKTFVTSIAYNQSIAHVARVVRRRRLSPAADALPAEPDLPDEAADRKQRQQHLLDAIQTLPLAQRQAIILYLEDFTFAEIGEALGISAHAAAMRCNRAKAALTVAMRTQA